MKIKLKYLIAVWVLIVALTLFILTDSLKAGITRPLIPNSELKWSSYHAYHCILYWDGDKVTYSAKRIRETLKACSANKKWAKQMVKRMRLNRYTVKKRVIKICDYITENFIYDSRYVWLEQARGRARANCSAYADMFYALCKAAGIPVRYVIGRANGYWHCWNKVQIKKKWYWVDTTWGRYPRRKLWKSHNTIVEEW